MDVPILSLLAQVRGWEAIHASNGVGIAITGMAIVFTALLVISLFLMALPHMIVALGPWAPKIERHAASPTNAERLSSDEEQIVAAIGFVLHHESLRAKKTSS